MARALINPNILTWARERSGLDWADVGQRMRVVGSTVRSWEEGVKQPTFKQARRLAEVLHIPFGYFYLSQPPAEELGIPDLRTIGDRGEEFSPDLVDVYKDALRKQSWLREYREDKEDEPLPFVGAFSQRNSPEEVAASVSSTLHIPEVQEKVAAGHPIKDSAQARFLSLLVEQAELVGITVLRSSIVGFNSHRALEVEEFRGFAISDPIAPFVFINSRDAKSAQIFTLIHELAHVWLDQSGVSASSIEPAAGLFRYPERGPGEYIKDLEEYCNCVAAEALVPQGVLYRLWGTGTSVEENVELAQSLFHVSSFVVARRAYDLGLIQQETYRDYYSQQMRLFVSRKSKQKSKNGPVPRSRLIRMRNGSAFTDTVVRSALFGETLYRDAAALLWAKPRDIKILAKEIRSKR